MISPEERSAVEAAVGRSRSEILSRAQRGEVSGDVVAQYTFPVDPALEQAISNSFAVDINGALGAERADLFLGRGWPELRRSLPLSGEDDVTMTIRRSGEDAPSKLSCEIRQGDSVSVRPVQYGVYPSSWFVLLFPGGWSDLAAREGFRLPDGFGSTR
jgi:hypothetical protein